MGHNAAFVNKITPLRAFTGPNEITVVLLDELVDELVDTTAIHSSSVFIHLRSHRKQTKP